MTAVTPGREELRDLIAEALCCEGNCIRRDSDCWKYSSRGHKKITDAILAIFDRLAAKPADEGVALEALRTIEFRGHQGKCPLCAGWDMSPNGETPGKHTKDCLIGKALSTTGKPKP